MSKKRKSAATVHRGETPSAKVRVARAMIDTAHGGRDQFGLKLSTANRKKLLEAAAKYLTEAQKEAQTTDSNN